MSLFRSHEETERIAAAEAAYGAAVADLRTSPANVVALPAKLDELRAAGYRAALPTKEAERIRRSIVSEAIDAALADDRLTADEEQALLAALAKLGVTDDNAEAQVPGIRDRLVVARVNDGRMPAVDAPSLLTRPGETVHLETNAELLKSVAVHEFRAGSQGFSFRIMKGVTYRVGATRGHMVTVGSELQTIDAGLLSVTSRRVVYAGGRKTLEFRYDRLVGLELYEDGIRLAVTNRQDPSLFRLQHVHAVAAVITAASQAT
jgi:hypothetical protein